MGNTSNKAILHNKTNNDIQLLYYDIIRRDIIIPAKGRIKIHPPFVIISTYNKYYSKDKTFLVKTNYNWIYNNQKLILPINILYRGNYIIDHKL